ncbi:atrial natriuretic peptide receptor 3-like [Babylonia areolata]|uniref:atrial natriuretic peptide receptor 3-like n=1 Tax=Babylonia areolata TaxID=304850 RepID=UPI003FD1B58E
MEHSLPGIEVAISRVRRQFLHHVKFHVTYRDSGCNGRDAPVFLFNMVSTNSVDVVFGPVCDYSLAPVGRYAPVWNIPVLTSGGFAHDFGRKEEEFSTLTRLGQNFEDLAEFVLDILSRFSWDTSHLIYDANGRNDIIEGFCFLAASGMIQKSKERKVTNAFHMYDTNTIEELLVQKVGLQFGVKPWQQKVLDRNG